MKPPLNDLERAYVAIKGPESYPAVLRLLLDSTLIFLIPYHPEFEDVTIKLKDGDRLPTFTVWKSGQDGNRIPIFTSVERANDAFKKMKVRERTYHFMEMRGKELFNILTLQHTPIAINPMTDFPSMYMGLPEIKKLADGSVFASSSSAPRQLIIEIVPPADYPTDFLQPLFRFLREQTAIKAAWLFRQVQPVPVEKAAIYFFMLKAVGETKRVREDFFAAARVACPLTAAFNVSLLEETNAEILKITSANIPFYAALDYQAPSPLGDAL